MLEQDGANVDLEIEQEKAKTKKDIEFLNELNELENNPDGNPNPMVRQNSFMNE